MSNELILILSLIAIYGAILVSYILFDVKGLICVNVIATIAANIEVLILINAFGMPQTLGNILFSATFLVTDILSEVAGKKQANEAVNIGIFTSLCFISLSCSWLLYTPSFDDWAFVHIHAIFSNTARMLIVGFVVYAIVQHFDVWLYHKWWNFSEKRYGSKKKFLWLRNNGSTLISQLLNTILFSIGAFAGTYDLSTVFSIICSSYVIFIVTSLADTPIVYLARLFHDKKNTQVKL